MKLILENQMESLGQEEPYGEHFNRQKERMLWNMYEETLMSPDQSPFPTTLWGLENVETKRRTMWKKSGCL